MKPTGFWFPSAAHYFLTTPQMVISLSIAMLWTKFGSMPCGFRVATRNRYIPGIASRAATVSGLFFVQYFPRFMSLASPLPSSVSSVVIQ
jgi:hypothetical protein